MSRIYLVIILISLAGYSFAEMQTDHEKDLDEVNTIKQTLIHEEAVSPCEEAMNTHRKAQEALKGRFCGTVLPEGKGWNGKKKKNSSDDY